MDTHKTYCKPFMETGYCSYGDTCKYLHIRDNEESICPICKRIFDLKVRAECGHCFCMNCISQEYVKNGKCVVCQKPISGGFIIEECM